MTEREMLRKAYENAGYEVCGVSRTRTDLMIIVGGRERIVDPLQDDGDAARLRTDMRFSAIHFSDSWRIEDENHVLIVEVLFRDHADKHAALRWATVLAASETESKS